MGSRYSLHLRTTYCAAEQYFCLRVASDAREAPRARALRPCTADYQPVAALTPQDPQRALVGVDEPHVRYSTLCVDPELVALNARHHPLFAGMVMVRRT